MPHVHPGEGVWTGSWWPMAQRAVISDDIHGVLLNIDVSSPSTNRQWRKPIIGSIKSGANSMPNGRSRGLDPRGRQARLPRARAAATSARVRSRGSTRSNRAKASNTPAIRRPADPVVSIPSSRLQNPMSRSSSWVTVAMRSRSERPRRSSRYTTRQSHPSRSSESACSSSGRSRQDPASVNTRSQPTARKASSWSSKPSESSAPVWA